MDFRDLYDERIRRFLCCLIVFLILLFIVNDGNILKDGRDERKYLQRKYNELKFFLKIKYIN